MVNIFLMEDILTEILDDIYKDKIKDISYTLVDFDSIKDLIPVSKEMI